METNCPHLERQPPFYTTVGHIPVPGEFHEGRLVTAMPLNPSQHTLTAPSALLRLSSPVAFNNKLVPAKASQLQLLSAQWPQRGEPFGRAPRSCGRSSRSAYIPAAEPVHIFSSIPSPVKITWNKHALYRYLWGTLAFPVETNCPHLERQPHSTPL